MELKAPVSFSTTTTISERQRSAVYTSTRVNPSTSLNRQFCPPTAPRSVSASGREYGIHKLVLCVHYNGVFIPYTYEVVILTNF